MSKEKQLNKEEMEELWTWMKDEPIFEKITDDLEKMFMDEMKGVLDILRAEVAAIDTSGQVDEYTKFIRTGEQIKQMVLDIIDKYKDRAESYKDRAESEEVE